MRTLYDASSALEGPLRRVAVSVRRVAAARRAAEAAEVQLKEARGGLEEEGVGLAGELEASRKSVEEVARDASRLAALAADSGRLAKAKAAEILGARLSKLREAEVARTAPLLQAAAAAAERRLGAMCKRTDEEMSTWLLSVVDGAARDMVARAVERVIDMARAQAAVKNAQLGVAKGLISVVEARGGCGSGGGARGGGEEWGQWEESGASGALIRLVEAWDTAAVPPTARYLWLLQALKKCHFSRADTEAWQVVGVAISVASRLRAAAAVGAKGIVGAWGGGGGAVTCGRRHVQCACLRGCATRNRCERVVRAV